MATTSSTLPFRCIRSLSLHGLGSLQAFGRSKADRQDFNRRQEAVLAERLRRAQEGGTRVRRYDVHRYTKCVRVCLSVCLSVSLSLSHSLSLSVALHLMSEYRKRPSRRRHLPGSGFELMPTKPGLCCSLLSVRQVEVWSKPTPKSECAKRWLRPVHPLTFQNFGIPLQMESERERVREQAGHVTLLQPAFQSDEACSSGCNMCSLLIAGSTRQQLGVVVTRYD